MSGVERPSPELFDRVCVGFAVGMMVRRWLTVPKPVRRANRLAHSDSGTLWLFLLAVLNLAFPLLLET